MSSDVPPRGALAWMANNRVAANLLMLLFLVGGALSVPNIRQEVFPSFELDVVQITIPYPGASPVEVEQGILLPLEEAVRGLDGVKRVNAAATENAGSLSIELLDGQNSYLVFQDIKNAVDRVTTLPVEAEEPNVRLLIARREVLNLVLFGDVEEGVLRVTAETVKDALARWPGITLVEVRGARAPEISIEIPMDQQRSHGLTPSHAARAVAQATIELGGGGLKTPGGEVLLRTAERRDYGSEYLDLPLTHTPQGAVLRVRDAAHVRDTFEDVDRNVLFNGQRALTLAVYQVGREDPVSVSKAAQAFIAAWRPRLPPSIDLEIIDDRSEIYRDRVNLLVRNAGQGLVLVLLVLGLFLEVRLAFWVMLGIPTSFLGAMLILPHVDVTINMISLFAFIVAVGIVVDDAIVVGESIYYERQQGRSGLAGAVRGVRAVAMPVTFAILTNILAFLPLLFVPGTQGQIWRNVPLVIITVFTISLVEALLILPAHLAHQRPQASGRFWRLIERPQQAFGRGLERFVERRYQPVIRACVRARYLTLAVAVAALLLTIGYIRGGRLPFTFFPKVEGDRVRAEAILPYGVPVSETEAIKARLLAALDAELAERGGATVLRGIRAQIGVGTSRGGPTGGQSDSGSHIANVDVLLVPLRDRTFTAAELTQAWRRRVGELPGLRSLTFRFNIGPGPTSPIDIQLSHPDPVTLERLAVRVADALREFAGVVEIEDGIARGKPEFSYRLKPSARALGLTAADLARQLREAFFGAEIKRQQRGYSELKIYARLPEAERRSLQTLEDFMLLTPGGVWIPLEEAAEAELGRAYEQILRVEGQRVLNITADVLEGQANAVEVMAALEQGILTELAQDHPNLSYTLEGERREQREAVIPLQRNFLFAMLGLFALLAIPFRSYIQALIIMIAIPFGIIGAVVGHLLLGYDLSLVSMMGIVALAGVVINDNILLISTANEHRAAGASVAAAAISAPVRRFRPVLLTSLTTFFGLAPIMLETSVQARFMIPMAISLAFGILFSTLISLILVPALYVIVEDLRCLWQGEPIPRPEHS